MKTKTPARKTRTKLPVASEPAAKLDLGKIFQAEYAAPRKPVLLETAPGRYLAVDGTGAPGGDVFKARIGALYAIAFTVKMTRKFSGEQDYSISRLEARYLNLDGGPLPPPEQWRWQLLIRTSSVRRRGRARTGGGRFAQARQRRRCRFGAPRIDC
jgi:hypothetical protein